MNRKHAPLLMALALLMVLGIFCWYLIQRTNYSVLRSGKHPKLDNNLTIDPTEDYYYELSLPDRKLHFNLVDPEQAPKEIREQVLRGWKIVDQTQNYAKEYVGNTLCCGNCHFAGGNTFGGKNGSISLVGSTGWYPSYSERSKTTLTIKDRINNCFMRSMNGTPPPEDSQTMLDIIAYLTFISKDVEFLKDKTPWRGLMILKSEHTPDTVNGKRVYVESCSPCHEPDGGGMLKEDNSLHIPALFGPNSFNDGAGMHRLDMLASFAYWNMPYQQPSLTEEEALDVAAYIREQPRPHFDPEKFEKKTK